MSGIVPNAGDTRSFFIRNSTTTAGSNGNVILAGGAGTLLKKATSTPTLVGDSDGSNVARVTFTRKANTDIIAAVEFFQD
jgi:hypothetical protein